MKCVPFVPFPFQGSFASTSHPDSSGHLQSFSSHTAYHLLHFTDGGVGAPQLNSQLSLVNLINPHFSPVLLEAARTAAPLSFFLAEKKAWSWFIRKPHYAPTPFFQGNFCELSISLARAHARAPKEHARWVQGEPFFRILFSLSFFIVLTSRLLARCCCFVSDVLPVPKNLLKSWCRLGLDAFYCPHICADLWHFTRVISGLVQLMSTCYYNFN